MYQIIAFASSCSDTLNSPKPLCLVERLIDRLAACAVAQANPTAVLHCVRVDATVTADVLQTSHTHTHTYKNAYHRHIAATDNVRWRVCTEHLLLPLLCSASGPCSATSPPASFSLLPSHTTLHTPLTQMFLDLLFMKHVVPSVTASSIFSEKYSLTGRQCNSQGVHWRRPREY